jgi:CubicO group peptidase (beta-lactamase class C family)
LYALDERPDRAVVANPDRLARLLERQRPEWEPGTRQAYHAITLGYYEGELLRRIDPRHRTIGQFFQEEIATPLGLDLYIRLPDDMPNSRFARTTPPTKLDLLRGFPLRLGLDALNPRSRIVRALWGSELPIDPVHVYARNFEVPSGGAVGTARAIAQAYSVFATGGRELGLRRETLELLEAPAVPAAAGFYDECMRGEARFSLGFMKPCPNLPFGSSDRTFGSPGAGGAMGLADPDAAIGYGYVTSQMGTTLSGDPRDVALREALYASVRKLSHSDAGAAAHATSAPAP